MTKYSLNVFCIQFYGTRFWLYVTYENIVVKNFMS